MGFDRLSATAVTLPTTERSAHLRLVKTSEAPPNARGRGAARPVAVGTLVALPILTTPDGRPFDLLEAANGNPVMLLFVPSDPSATIDDDAVTAWAPADLIEAAAGQLFIIVSRAEAMSDTNALLLDRDGGFAYSLGLADWDYERGCADLGRPVGLVLNEVGRVVATDFGGSPDLEEMVDGLSKSGRTNPGKGRRW